MENNKVLCFASFSTIKEINARLKTPSFFIYLLLLFIFLYFYVQKTIFIFHFFTFQLNAYEGFVLRAIALHRTFSLLVLYLFQK